MNLFYTDRNFTKSYVELINDINECDGYNLICKHSDYYQLFKDLILSIIANNKIVLIDSNLSIDEISKLNINTELLEKIELVSFPKIKNEFDLVERITKSTEWELTLFTSGTTGNPKKITHNLTTITKSIKTSPYTKNNVWGFAYDPTHIAGIQVFFQALLNINHIIRFFQLSKKEILANIETNNVTNISATPTFYRLILENDKSFTTVRNITFGGEKFDESLRLPISKMFPCAKILNIYASTEIGTLFAAENDVFYVKNEQTDLVKIYENELYVAGILLGKSDDLALIDGWYKTGDRVEIVSQNPLGIRFLGRINESINVGGYKVYPTEVEEVINSLSGVRRSRVYGKKNSVVGNIVICEIELDNVLLTENQVKSMLSTRLQAYKIPRIISFVDEIKITRNGKVDRK